MDEVDEDLRVAVLDASVRPGRLRAHFQPIVDLDRGVTTGYEALARFVGPPQASPDVWFAAAHRLGVGERLEARALETALASRATLPDNCFLTVNLGPAAILSPAVRDVLDAAGDLRGIVVEITEQQPVDDYDALNDVLAPLRARGAMIAVDDAGAGFASLNHIAALAPSLIKIDRALVSGVDRDDVKAAVVEMLGLFASRIDAWVLAEGVETLPELERLLSLGVPLAQGYGLGRPAPAMGPADPAALAVCRRRGAQARHGDVGALAEPVAAVEEGAADAAVAEAFLRRPGARWVAVVDEFRRPTALIPRGRVRRQAPLCVLAGESLPAVVRRITTRPASERLVPIAFCDELGRLVGLVPVERVLDRLADLADGAASAPPEPEARTA